MALKENIRVESKRDIQTKVMTTPTATGASLTDSTVTSTVALAAVSPATPAGSTPSRDPYPEVLPVAGLPLTVQSDLANWTRGDRKARFEQTAERHAGGSGSR